MRGAFCLSAGRWHYTRNQPIAKQKCRVDWSALETDYRAGKLTVRAIADKYGISVSGIYRRVRRHAWQRTKIDTEKENRLTSTAHGFDDELGLLRNLATKLRTRLERVIDGKSVDGVVLGDRESPATLLLKLCQINEKIISLEHRLAGEPATTTPLEMDAHDHRILERFKHQCGLERSQDR